MRSQRSAAIDVVPEPERAQAFVDELRTLIKASYVILARYDQNGNQIEMFPAEKREGAARQIEWLQAERLLQSRSGGAIPRISDALIALDGMRGLVAVYGKDGSIFGLAIVARPRPFSLEERAALTGTLPAGSALMRRLSTFSGEKSAKARTSERSTPAQFVLSRDYRVESRWVAGGDENDALQKILALVEDTLPPVIDAAVRGLTESWTDDPETWEPGLAVPLPFMVVRTVPLTGSGGLKIGMLVERYRARNPLRLAAEKYAMSPRELDVLALVLKGFGTPQIATTLEIAESTAHDHVKRMMLKTRAHNRVELASKTLGWST